MVRSTTCSRWLTLGSLGLQYDDETFARIIDKYLHLDLYNSILQDKMLFGSD
jgi:hypothetical protein